MNICVLIGNVASEPELRYTAGGRAACTFRLAVSRAGSDQADFFTIVAWERQAEVCKEYLQVGRRVSVEGRLHQSGYGEQADGMSRKVEIVANRVHLLGRAAPVMGSQVTLTVGDDEQVSS